MKPFVVYSEPLICSIFATEIQIFKIFGTGCLKKPSPELFLCFLDKNGCLNPVHPPKWQVTDPKRVLAAHGHQRNPFIASSGVRSMLFLRSFREKSRIVFIRTNFPPNSIIKIRIIFLTCLVLYLTILSFYVQKYAFRLPRYAYL